MNAIVSRRALAAGLALVATLAAKVGGASTVILVRPANPKAITAEALVRMHGELVSAGFDVEIMAATAGVDPRASLEQTASGNNVDAVVALLGDAIPGSVEVWVIDRVTGKSVVRRIPNQPESERAAEILAIRAIELLAGEPAGSRYGRRQESPLCAQAAARGGDPLRGTRARFASNFARRDRSRRHRGGEL